MAPRFPLEEAPDANIKDMIGDALHVMHGGPPPFQWVAEDGGSLVGCYAPLSYVSAWVRPSLPCPCSCPPGHQKILGNEGDLHRSKDVNRFSLHGFSFTPTVARSFFDVAKVVYGAVQPRYRELAILGLSSVMPVPVIVQHHREIAPTVQLTLEQYDEGLAGQVPRNLSDGEVTAYELGRKLTAQTGPLDDATWKDVTSHITKAEVVGIVHVISGYRWVALLEQVNGEAH